MKIENQWNYKFRSVEINKHQEKYLKKLTTIQSMLYNLLNSLAQFEIPDSLRSIIFIYTFILSTYIKLKLIKF